MSIKEIIDSERWELFGGFDTEVKRHNASLDRIYTAVIESEMALINQIKLWSADCTAAEKHITDLEKQVGSVNDALSILDLVQIVPLVNGLKERIAELEGSLDEYKGHFLDGLKECWYRGESIKSLQEHLDTANKRITELEAQLPKVIEPKNGTCMCGNLVRGFDPVHYGWKYNYCPNCGAKLKWEDA